MELTIGNYWQLLYCHTDSEVKYDSVMLCGSDHAGGTGVLHKTDGAMKKEHYGETLKAASQNISQEGTAWAQMAVSNREYP